MKINKFIKTNQGEKSFYLTSITVNELLKNSKIDYYRAKNNFKISDSIKVNKGYVEKLPPAEWRKIAKEISVMIKENNLFLLEPIFCVINKEKFLNEENMIFLEEEMKIIKGLKYFEAFKYLEEKSSNFKKELSIIEIPIVLIPVENLETEIDLFINMNSKNNFIISKAREVLKELKKVKKQIRNFDELADSLSEDITDSLINMKDSVWKGKISCTIRDKEKSIGYGTFKNSLKKVVKVILNKYKFSKVMNYKDKNYNDFVLSTTKNYNAIWQLIKSRWTEAFEDCTNYTLTKSWGVNFINDVICYYIEKDNINKIFEKLSVSRISNSFWKRDGYGKVMDYSTERDFESLMKLIK
jgi:hypothetical protein